MSEKMPSAEGDDMMNRKEFIKAPFSAFKKAIESDHGAEVGNKKEESDAKDEGLTRRGFLKKLLPKISDQALQESATTGENRKMSRREFLTGKAAQEEEMGEKNEKAA